MIRLIKSKIGYVDLERLPIAKVDEMFEKLQDTDAIIMDMCGYPQGTAWSMAPGLSEKPEPVAAQFRRNLVMANNEFETGIVTLLFEQRLPATSKPLNRGRTMMLIDERGSRPNTATDILAIRHPQPTNRRGRVPGRDRATHLAKVGSGGAQG